MSASASASASANLSEDAYNYLLSNYLNNDGVFKRYIITTERTFKKNTNIINSPRILEEKGTIPPVLNELIKTSIFSNWTSLIDIHTLKKIIDHPCSEEYIKKQFIDYDLTDKNVITTSPNLLNVYNTYIDSKKDSKKDSNPNNKIKYKNVYTKRYGTKRYGTRSNYNYNYNYIHKHPDRENPLYIQLFSKLDGFVKIITEGFFEIFKDNFKFDEYGNPTGTENIRFDCRRDFTPITIQKPTRLLSYNRYTPNTSGGTRKKRRERTRTRSRTRTSCVR